MEIRIRDKRVSKISTSTQTIFAENTDFNITYWAQPRWRLSRRKKKVKILVVLWSQRVRESKSFCMGQNPDNSVSYIRHHKGFWKNTQTMSYSMFETLWSERWMSHFWFCTWIFALMIFNLLISRLINVSCLDQFVWCIVILLTTIPVIIQISSTLRLILTYLHASSSGKKQ